MHRSFGPALLVACLSLNCANAIHSADILTLFNSNQPNHPPFEPVSQEMRDLTRQSLADAYYCPECVNAFLNGLAPSQRITEAMACVSGARGPEVEDQCIHTLYDRLAFPPAPPPEQRNPQAWALEQDVTRLAVNLKQLVRAGAQYHRTSQLSSVAPNETAVINGVAGGIAELKDYLLRRHVRRERSHALTAWVLSGGAANGAYSAGAAWWLLTRLDACQRQAEQSLARACPGRDAACISRQRQLPTNACLEDHVDMVSGTSAGAVTALVVKSYFSRAPNARRRALDLLQANYTCSSNRDLYCVTNSDLNQLGLDSNGRALGLVRFDGFANLLRRDIGPETFDSVTEDFVSTVEFQSGRLLQLSSSDRFEIPGLTELKQAVMASVVEPLLAEPVTRIGNRHGQFLDGGVRSGLPLRSPLQRGANRALILVNAPIEPRPLEAPPPHALAIGERTLELFSHQPIISELHEAEYELAARRSLEYELCEERLESPGPLTHAMPPQCSYQALSDTALKPLPADRVAATVPLSADGKSSAAEIDALCSGEVWPEAPGSGKAVPEQASTSLPRSISQQYRSSQLFQPHVLPASLQGPQAIEPDMRQEELFAPGYSFEPKTMWKLFVFGAAVMQERCREVNETLAWHLREWCGSPDDLKRALAPLRQHAEGSCWNKSQEIRLCRPGDSQEIQ